MTRLFHCPAIGSLLAVAVVAAGTTGCAPDNDVKPGAPVLTKFVLVQQGYAHTNIDSSAGLCPTAVTTGAACIAADDPGTEVVEVPDTMCQQEASHDWCQCDASGAAPVWACGPFDGVRAVVAVFDRLLDPTPLSAGPAAPPDSGASDTVMLSLSAGAPDTTLLTDYTSNGSASGLLLPFFAYAYYMNYRLDGPSLFTVPSTTFPSGATVTLKLNPLNVRAKDGTTPFTGDGLLADGTLSFTTPDFGASVPPAAIAPDTSPVFVIFNNLVNVDDVASHITLTSSTGPVAVTIGTIDTDPTRATTISIQPAGDATWPAGATLTIKVDATTPNVLGQTLGAEVTGMVTTSAS